MNAPTVNAPRFESPFLRGREEVAAYLRVSPRTVDRLRKKRLLPTPCRGMALIWRKDAIDAAIARLTVPPVEATGGRRVRRL